MRILIVGAGAKILGPFTVGAGAKVGSNAVVTKEVPAGATVVGIPGKIVQRRDPDSDPGLEVDPARREAMCQKFGFDAYGMSQDMPDPVAKSMQAMLDHMHAVDERISGMCKTLRQLDHSYRDGQMPEIRDEDFAEILEDVDRACAPVIGRDANADILGTDAATGNESASGKEDVGPGTSDQGTSDPGTTDKDSAGGSETANDAEHGAEREDEATTARRQ